MLNYQCISPEVALMGYTSVNPSSYETVLKRHSTPHNVWKQDRLLMRFVPTELLSQPPIIPKWVVWQKKKKCQKSTYNNGSPQYLSWLTSYRKAPMKKCMLMLERDVLRTFLASLKSQMFFTESKLLTEFSKSTQLASGKMRKPDFIAKNAQSA